MRFSLIRLIVVIAVYLDFRIIQLDVKIAFLNVKLDELYIYR